MFRSKMAFLCALLLLNCNAIAEDVYITGGDSTALQEAINTANEHGSKTTIHLEAGQVFEGSPFIGNFSGNLKIQGNGAIFGFVGLTLIAPLSIASDGVVTITGVTFAYVGSGLLCSFIHNLGSLSLERVTFTNILITTPGHFVSCDKEELLLNDGFAELFNVTIAGTMLGGVQRSVIRTSENATTHISHLTIVDTSLIGGGAGVILNSASEGSISVSNSIILADGDQAFNLVPCAGPIIDNGGNFSSRGDCGFSGGAIERSELNQTVEKGHDAWVVPLISGSVATDAGNPDFCAKLDGRGFERDVQCDSGAYELSASGHSGELGRGGISGFYWTPDSDGNFVQVQRAYDGNVVVIWNTFDTSGSQAWVYGVGSYDDGVVMADAYRSLDGILQPGAGASGGITTNWGTIKVTPHDCYSITVEYASTDPEFGSGSFEAKRIAYVHDLGCSHR